MHSNDAAAPGGASATSRKPPRVIKNPLLSSQVTGLTLDDFAPVAVLMPAAPLATIVKDRPESTAPTKPVIFSSQQTVTGTVPELPQDTDSFSEIDLNATSDPQAWTRPPTIDYNPLQDLEESDNRGSAGPLGDDGEPLPASYLQQTSALTAQFAAQLPNVASTVFSTFSRVIKGTSPVPPPTAVSYPNDPSVYGGSYDAPSEFPSVANPYEVQPVAPLLNPSTCEPSYPPASVLPGSYQHLEAQPGAGPVPPPPTFYNPDQIPSAVVPPPSAVPGLSNAYRLGGSRKKTYAHIPGLSTSAIQPVGGVSLPPPTQSVAAAAAAAAPPFGTGPSTTLAFVPPSAPGVGDPFPANRPEEIPSVQPVAKGKPSLFGYLPTNILEKLPKPSFGSEKREEPSPFTGGIASESIVDPFSDHQPIPVEIQPVARPPSSGTSVPGLFASSLVDTASLDGGPVSASVGTQAHASSFFTTNPVETPEVIGTVPEPTTNATPAAPPTFFSPGQVPTVLSAPPSTVSTRSNPYSSARLGAGVGRYKNPLAPIVPSATGPVFLPNQPPPLSSLQAGKTVAAGNAIDVSVPPGVFTPQGVHPEQPPVAVSLVNAPPEVSATPAKFEQHLTSSVGAILLENPQQSVVTTVSKDQFPPVATSILNPLAPDNIYPGANPDNNPLGLFTSDSNFESAFNPVVTEQDHQVTREGSNFNAQQFQQVATNLEQFAEPAPPIIGFQPQPEHVTLGSASVPSQYDAFELGTTTTRTIGTTAAVAPKGLNPSFLGTEATPFGHTKTIVDSRSKSSENVLSPPPRPNSNLSEPAAIFPGSVPPADIFLPELTESCSAPAQERYQKRAEEERNDSAQDSNGNNLLNFFIGTPTEPSGLVDKQVSSKKAEFSLTGPTPAINPVDFFNSNTISPPPSATVENSIKTGQSISSVPLFSFFGRAADPAPPSVPEVATEAKQEGVQNVQNPEPKSAVDVVSPSSVSNVSSFSNLNDRYEEDGEQGLPRIENASNEPIFSSDNLFDFKSSAFRNGSVYLRDIGNDTNDGNSSMAAMAATSVGAQDTTATTNTGTSIAESSTTNIAYRPTYNHWFYRREVEGKSIWSPFTMADSMALEDGLTALQSQDDADPKDDAALVPVVVHTDGGRYDVSIRERTRTPVYWKGAASEVRRCSWFYKTVDSRFVPYEEEVADLLEREYKEAATSGEWHRRVTIPNGETVVFHGPSVIVHFLQTQNPDTWGSGSSPVPSTTNRPRVVKRGIDEFNIDDDEPEKIDHLLFMVHGIGEACDLRFRRVEEVVDEFRSISAQLVQSHYRSSFDRGDVGRVEILPISWHDDLHSEESGVDEKLKSITLPSIPKLRHFTNDTLLDVLFYTSPMFCQSIIDAVGKSLNRLYAMFCQRNPSFNGRVSLAGHSLGSLILFDLLCHQKRVEPRPTAEPENSENPDGDSVSPLTSRHAVVNHRPLVRKCSQQINYEVGPAGTGQPYITYPQLMFQPKMFFALGSPIGMFVTIRGIDALGLDFKLPTCDGFFNIFHPYDPVAYRIEALVNPELSALAPVLIPHHKGRKRMHLELKETVLRVGNDLRQRVSDVFRNTLDTVYSLTAMGSRPDSKAIQKEVDKVLQDQLKFDTAAGSTSNLSGASDVDSGETTLPLGQLNQTRRVDYVLQEAPFEFINEYLFALTSHVCYWDSEDTMLFLMKEIYSSLGVQTDHQVPQQSMTIERPLAATSPTVAASTCSLNSNYNLFPHDVPSAREAPDSRL